MRASTHELIGAALAVGGARVAHAGVEETAATVAVAFYGSWLPDADQLGSRVQRRTRLERRFALVGLAGLVARLPVRAFGLLARHRGATHSLLAIAALSAAAALTGSVLGSTAALVAGGGVALGYGGHVAADACTPGGVPLLAPFSRRRMWLVPRPARVPTGGLRERVLAATILFGGAAALLGGWAGP